MHPVNEVTKLCAAIFSETEWHRFLLDMGQHVGRELAVHLPSRGSREDAVFEGVSLMYRHGLLASSEFAELLTQHRPRRSEEIKQVLGRIRDPTDRPLARGVVFTNLLALSVRRDRAPGGTEEGETLRRRIVFRIGVDPRRPICDVRLEVHLVVARDIKQVDGTPGRATQFFPLGLDKSRAPSIRAFWTVAHTVDPDVDGDTPWEPACLSPIALLPFDRIAPKGMGVRAYLFARDAIEGSFVFAERQWAWNRRDTFVGDFELRKAGEAPFSNPIELNRLREHAVGAELWPMLDRNLEAPDDAPEPGLANR